MAHDGIALRDRFQDVVTSEAELRAIVGHPPQRSVDKVVRVIDEHCRRFITHAPFVFVASAGTDGMIDVSPKGDPAGFVKVLDENTIAIPDRLGNRRLDTYRNVLQNPNVGLIFVIPGITHTLRISGKAIIVRDIELRQQQAARARARRRGRARPFPLPEMHDSLGSVAARGMAGHQRVADLCRDADRAREARRHGRGGAGGHRDRQS